MGFKEGRKKKVVVSVINDLTTDQRVYKVCCLLTELGYEVTCVGRRLKNSLPMPIRSYQCKRMNLLFETGVLFYLEFNCRLFLYLLGQKADVLVANDLDTLLPNYIHSKWKRIPLVYDSHELFTEVPELANSPIKKSIWKRLERSLLPKVKYIVTVSNSISNWYAQHYRIKPPIVVRNVPLKNLNWKKEENFNNISSNQPTLILQGAGININRGAEELIKAMAYLPECRLMLIGGGDAYPLLVKLAQKLKLENQIQFYAKMPYLELMKYTCSATIGITLDKPTNLNYLYSLPNKLFDYLSVGLPVLASNLPEVKEIVVGYNCGAIVESVSPEVIAIKIKEMLSNPKQLEEWRTNAVVAGETLVWEKESQKLIHLYRQWL